MADIGKALRHKRFQIADSAPISCILENKLGEQFNLKLENCSLSGIGGSVEKDIEAHLPTEGEILPSCKIKINDHEYSLGRTIVRVIKFAGNSTFLGLSLVDGRMPLDGYLSKYLKIDLDDSKSIYDFELSSDKFTVANFTDSAPNNSDLFSRFSQFQIFLEDWKRTNKYAYATVRSGSKGVRINLDRKRKTGRHDYLVMGSNDYLGLASHPKVIEATKKALEEFGFGSTGSPVTTGLSSLHEDLKNTLSSMFRKESAILFNSGYVSNIGILTSVVRENDLVIADYLSHASIQDGLRMTSATSRYFLHNNTKHLEKILRDQRNDYAGSLIVTEGAFSMDGDVAPIDEIYKLSRKYHSRLMVDEAHSFGVLGPTGLGAAEKFGLLPNTDIIMGTFSKICGAIGGFVVGSNELIDWLHHFSRPYIFSVSLPPSTVAATLAALKIFQEEKHLVERLQQNIKHFMNGLEELGLHKDYEQESAVIPVVIGDEEKLGIMNEVLLEKGVFVVPIIYPAVSKNNCRFRFTIMASHTIADLDYVLEVLEKAMIKADFTFEQPESVEKKSSSA